MSVDLTLHKGVSFKKRAIHRMHDFVLVSESFHFFEMHKLMLLPALGTVGFSISQRV